MSTTKETHWKLLVYAVSYIINLHLSLIIYAFAQTIDRTIKVIVHLFKKQAHGFVSSSVGARSLL